jgi:SAM-dependent methyltransferase
MKNDWWKNLFNNDYLATYGDITNAEITGKQIDFLTSKFTLGAMLDVACGQGRHTLELAQRGYRVVGLDYSLDLLNKAKENPHKNALFVHTDMRGIPFEGVFDSVINLMSSFGYFEDEEDHELVLRQMNKALKKGGLLVMDLKNPTPAIKELAGGMKEQTDTLSNGLVVTTKDWFNEETKHWHTTRSWKEKEYSSSVRLFTLKEMAMLLEKTGFELKETLQGYSNNPATEESKRILYIARKR